MMKGKLFKKEDKWEVKYDHNQTTGMGFSLYNFLPLHPDYVLNADLMYPDSNGMEIEFNIEGDYAVPFRDEFYITLHPDLQKSTPMIEKLREHLHSITPEQFQKEIKEIQDEGYVDGVYICKDIDCPHCAYETQQMWEDELERGAAIDFAKWLAQDWMSIWVDGKWMWECQTNPSPYSEKYGYLTEEQLYEVYLKNS